MIKNLLWDYQGDNKSKILNKFYKLAEAAIGDVLWKRMFLKITILQILQEKICAGVSFQLGNSYNFIKKRLQHKNVDRTTQ